MPAPGSTTPGTMRLAHLRSRALPLLVSSSLLFGCGGAGTPATDTPDGPATPYTVTTGDLEAALAGTFRDADRARDVYRHPRETLTFFGIEPDMTVVECWPGGGWYTRILAPLLRDHGRLISGGLPLDDPRRGQYERSFRAMVAAHPELYDQIQLATLHPGDFLEAVPDASVDAVLTFRSVHNWIRSEGHDPNDYFRAIHRVLRPGGVLGVVQHRAPDDLPEARDGTTGYVSEARVIELALAAGLTLEARSELNANPRDTHRHPEGVWSLPPVMRGEGMTRAEREAIGESDRMTLRFRKPR